MNLVNLKRIYNHILLNVPKNMLKMVLFRYGNERIHECDSVGCVLGHCTVLDNWDEISKFTSGNIDFAKWSKKFTGLEPYSDYWDWCFGGSWPSSKEQILLRIKYFIDNQNYPDNWESQDNYQYLLPVEKLYQYELD